MTDKEEWAEDVSLRAIEKSLIAEYAEGVSTANLPCVFVLGSPRTGSTLVYQFLINQFQFHYPTNLLNDSFVETPVAGALFERGLSSREAVEYKSHYGKTQGPLGPSEASGFFKRWFGGEHPSETCSKEPLPGMEAPMLETFAALYGLSGNPWLFKNAWNCFRIKSLARLFPSASFIWIRRDIRQSARSDLEARAKRGGYDVWNSATPHNHLEIRQRPHWEQVVEQQYEYGRRITSDFAASCPDRSLQVWYEDLCLEPDRVLQRLEDFVVGLGMGDIRREPMITFSPSLRKRDLDSEEEGRRILSYVQNLPDDRLTSFYHEGEPAPC